MSTCYPSTPGKMAKTVALFATGAGLFYIGLHYSHVNVAPLQAKTKARNDYVKERLKIKYGYGMGLVRGVEQKLYAWPLTASFSAQVM